MTSAMTGQGRGFCRAVAATLAVAVLALACGRKAPPRPPQWVIPRSPEPVQVVAVPEGLKVTWHRPKTYVDGTSLEDLDSFLVLRACAPDWNLAPIAKLPVTDRERFRKGATFSVIDHDVGADAECLYQVIATTADDYSSPPAEGLFPPPPPTPTPEPTPTAPGDAAPATPTASATSGDGESAEGEAVPTAAPNAEPNAAPLATPQP